MSTAPEINKIPVTLVAPMSEFSASFVQGMANRMAVSHHKYGFIKDAAGKVDFVASALQRVELYFETGNTEGLVDAANFLMAEFMHPQVEEAHFTPTDADGSPGRKGTSGTDLGAERNDAL